MSVMVVAEVGINHNGSLATAFELIQAAAAAGADAVKFQVGTPRLYVNESEWDEPRVLADGTVVPYIEYRESLELNDSALIACKRHALTEGLEWFASPLDVDAVGRLEEIGVERYKVASPMVTNTPLLDRLRATDAPVIVSTGMTTVDDLDRAVIRLGWDRVTLMHCTSEYPCPPEHNNLRCITELQRLYPCVPVGYSGHEIGIPESVAAVALGATVVERHLTLSRASWGSDQAASLEPDGLRRLIGYIRTVERALGDGQKVVYAGEMANARKFRLDTHTQPSAILDNR